MPALVQTQALPTVRALAQESQPVLVLVLIQTQAPKLALSWIRVLAQGVGPKAQQTMAQGPERVLAQELVLVPGLEQVPAQGLVPAQWLVLAV